MDNVGYLIAIIFLELLIVSKNGCLGTISCFVCSSRNGSNIACEDPFNAGASTYTERCKVPKRGHIGEFPAHFCIKIIGTSYATSERLVVRRCTMETMDTQCGKFRFEDDLLRGCILTCSMDGCNSSNVISNSKALLWLCLFFSVLIISSSSLLSPSQTSKVNNLRSNIKVPELNSMKQKYGTRDIEIEHIIPKRRRTTLSELA